MPKVDGRFTWNHGDISIYDKDGNNITYANQDYFKTKKEENKTFMGEIHIGDVVKTKGTGRLVVIKYIDYTFNNLFHSDYAGVLYNSDEENLIMLGFDDIEKVVLNSDTNDTKSKIL